jgi:4-methyl-5(b-hydroxyethyl)-thiazole monophosphate biosynthesis
MPNVLVPLAPGCEELEAVTIIDLLRRAEIKVVAAGLEEGPITASRGVRLMPDVSLADVLSDEFDMIVLPGGIGGAQRLQADSRITELLQRMAQANHYIAAVCAAPKVLASAGLLEGRQATAYPGALDDYTKSTTVSAAAVVQDERIITSRGPGTAMDFALSLIEILCGQDKRNSVEAALQRS